MISNILHIKRWCSFIKGGYYHLFRLAVTLGLMLYIYYITLDEQSGYLHRIAVYAFIITIIFMMISLVKAVYELKIEAKYLRNILEKNQIDAPDRNAIIDKEASSNARE